MIGVHTMKSRDWLNGLQATLNDAHMIVTDCVAADGRGMSADEVVALHRIDMAIMHVHAMREDDAMHADERKLHVRSTL